MMDRFSRWFMLLGALVAASIYVNPSARADIFTNASVGGAPTGVNYVNFDNLPLGTAGGTSGGIGVSFASDGQAVQGAVGGQYAAPYLSNSNGVLFGDNTVSGPDTTTYLTTGLGSVTLIAARRGEAISASSGDRSTATTPLSFYDGGSLVGTVTGSDVNSERQWQTRGPTAPSMSTSHSQARRFRQGRGVEHAIRFRVRQRLLQRDGPDARAQHDADRWVRLARRILREASGPAYGLGRLISRDRPGQPARRSMRQNHTRGRASQPAPSPS